MCRWGTVAATVVALVACWTLMTAPALAVTQPGGAGTVSPILECVWHVGSTNWLAL